MTPLADRPSFTPIYHRALREMLALMRLVDKTGDVDHARQIALELTLYRYMCNLRYGALA